VRAALARVPEEQRALVPWNPESIDWRHYWLEVHLPGVEKYVWPIIEARIARPNKPLRAHDDLAAFLDEIAERHEHAPALMVRHPDGFSRTSFRELRDRARATARRLASAGVRHGDRVLLAGRNHPDWVVGYFGILLAGGTAVPLDPALDGADAARIEDKSQPRLALLDRDAAASFGAAIGVERRDLHDTTAPGRDDPLPGLRIKGDDVASILFTSGTTGEPKGVMLTHTNFCSLLASLSRVFELTRDDRVLSVLPLHHTFEFTCGLLLPLSRGSRIIYLDEITGEKLASTLRDARVTAMVGVPALWQLLERRMQARVQEQGPMVAAAFDAGLEFNRWLGRTTGMDLGRLLFGKVHQGLGGNIRLLISGGAALPEDTHRFFAGLGLHLAEGYGLTEAAPVLTADPPGPGARPGTAGRPIPGVELRIAEPDDQGVGEVLARGPNVMKGYFRDEASSRAAVDDDGWLHTGDLGRIDSRGCLVIVGRAKDVVVTAAGENIHLDDVEARLGEVPHEAELSLVGLPDGKGGELLGLLARAAEHSRHHEARDALRKAVRKLPVGQRPALTYLVDAPLPRTATRKVKRREVRDVLERIHEAAKAAERPAAVGGGGSPVRRAVAHVAGKDATTLAGSARIADELGFDSLMWVELAAALDDLPGGAPHADRLTACETIADLEALVAAHTDAPERVGPEVVDDGDGPSTFRFPAPLVEPLRKLLRSGQRGIYENLLDVTVTGRALIPTNRQVIVVSNHCSHIDMGLAKTALGAYGEGMVALAAADYFFEGHPIWVAYFDQLTNLEPLARGTSYRSSLRQALEVVREGRVVLLFPEGGRQGDGILKDFKPLIGKLILQAKLDVLPMYLWGTHAALPKGSFLPRGRKVGVRIGPVVPFEELVRLSAGAKPSAAPRTIAQVLHAAVRELRDGSALDVTAIEAWDQHAAAEPVDPLADLFAELRERFLPDAVTEAASWYFSLGGEAGRWTVSVEPGACTIVRGKPQGGAADCVIKTSADLWTRMVRDGYVPEISEFVTGVIKTSDLNKLQAFAQCFRLGPLTAGDDPQTAGATA
jgi:long-chain acyl-CoA synthetase